jgi:hypothetical protein
MLWAVHSSVNLKKKTLSGPGACVVTGVEEQPIVQWNFGFGSQQRALLLEWKSRDRKSNLNQLSLISFNLEANTHHSPPTNQTNRKVDVVRRLPTQPSVAATYLP